MRDEVGCRRTSGALCASRSTGPAGIFIRSGADIDRQEMPAWWRREPVMKIAGFFIGRCFYKMEGRGWDCPAQFAGK
jgi:hypothetical protein